MDLGSKVQKHFPNYWVKKNLSRTSGLEFLPKYVSEYILGVFTQDSVSEEEGLTNSIKFVNKFYPEANSSDLLKHTLVETNTLEIIQKIKVNVELKSDEYYTRIPVLNETVWVDPSFVQNYPSLLTTGMWGKLTLLRDRPDNTAFPILLADFSPFQLGAFDQEELFIARSHFTLKEWIDLLLISIGLNPTSLNSDAKLFILCRLLPLLRRNMNFAEFGPKSTGKTYIYRNFSSFAHIVSGSAVTPAKFVYDIAKNTPGLISTNDAVIFDEVTGAEFGSKKDYEMIGLLKDYMEGGHVSRGRISMSEDTSLVFIGNIDIKGREPKFRDFSRDLPLAFSDTAFLDRIHGIIPGWKIPKISTSKSALSDSVGLMSNYLGEMLHSLRRFNHPDLDWNRVTSNFNMVRNEKAVRIITEGLLALLFPGVTASTSDINFCLNLACSLRQNLYDQLNFLDPEEFPQTSLEANYS